MKNQRSPMGDYGFGVSGADQSLSPVDLGQINNNHSLFSPDPLTTQSKMQDDNLLEKGQVKANLMGSFNETASEPRLEDATNGLELNGDSRPSNGVHGDQRNNGLNDDAVNSVITSLSQLGLTTDANITGPNSVSSAPGLWSTAGVDEGLIPAMQAINGFPQHPHPAPGNHPVNGSGSFGTLPNQHLPLTTLAGMQQQPPPLRRAITGQNRTAIQQMQQNIFLNNPKTYQSWSNGSPHMDWTQRAGQLQNPWSGLPTQRKSMGSLNNLAVAGQFKKSNFNPAMVMSPSKFRRSTSHPAQYPPTGFGHKTGLEMNGLDHRDQFEQLLALQQERSGTMDPVKLAALDTHMLDLISRPTDRVANPEQLKVMAGQGNLVFAPQLDPRLLPKGKLPFGLSEMDGHHILDDNSIDQTVPNLSSPGQGSPGSQNSLMDRFSRKVFVGGLPPDIDEEEITAAFRRFGPLVVDWPHKAESKSYFPPKGYCFLIFQDEMSVHHLTASCIVDDSKLYWCVSSPTMKDKPVQIRPWSLGDSDFVMDGTQPLDPRKTIFVGGVPRPLRAVELAMIMDRLYGGVCYAGIDTDPELKYPKGAGRVAFSSQQSYIAAISARFVQLQHGDIDKRVEVKPYVLDDQMCDECQGARCGGKFAPFFCASITCLQYYCESCWGTIHSRQGREFHKPLVKEGADRPRTVPFRWC